METILQYSEEGKSKKTTWSGHKEDITRVIVTKGGQELRRDFEEME